MTTTIDCALYTNGTILTMDPQMPEAEAIATVGQRIVAVGDRSSVHSVLPPIHRNIDLAGRTLTPGFNEAHNHMIMFGQTADYVDASFPNVTTISEITERFRGRSESVPAGEWIIGRGYDDNKLGERRHPNRDDLDLASTNHPILLVNGSGHLAAVNSLALERAGVTERTADPPGGHFVRDAQGRLTGVLHETAQQPIRDVIPEPTLDDHIRSLKRCNDEYVRAGITSSQDAGSSDGTQVRAFQFAVERGDLKLRTSMMIRENLLPQVEGFGIRQGFGNNQLRVGPIKMFIDGSLIGRTAAVTQPFLEDPSDDNLGLTMMERDELNDYVLRAHTLGYQIAIHAIGDRGIDMVLDAYELALNKQPRQNHRHRIEHCGICRPDILDRIARLGVVPVSQPVFIDEYGDGFIRHLGLDRIQLTYPFRSFLDLKIPLVFSSDCPVSSFHPLKSIQAAVTEHTSTGRSYAIEEAVTVEEALYMYTVAGAYATFEEQEKGAIKTGMLADFTILEEDPRLVDPFKLSEIPVSATIIGGQVVFES